LLRYISITALLTTLAACSGESANAKLPNQPAVSRGNIDGKNILHDWSFAIVTTAGMKSRITPDKKEFAGAETWIVDVPKRDASDVAMAAFSQAGMSNINILAQAKSNTAAMNDGSGGWQPSIDQ